MAKASYVNYSLQALGLFSLIIFAHQGEATTFTVGGSKGWSVPSDNGPIYNQWAERMRFQIGDSLLFAYPASSDSVLQVATKDDYTNCATNSPLEKYTDGHTEIKLSQSGPHYFISGNKDNCLKNEKLVVVVLADRSNKTSSSPQTPPSSLPSASSPAPTPSSDQPVTRTAPIPSSDQPVTPIAPVPSSDQAGSPPTPTPAADQPNAAPSPSDTSGTKGSPAPSADSHPRNGAATFVVSIAGTVGAFVGSSLLLAF